ncbi:hypothetical protein ACJMK2_018861 [Sinanodonta woodiana]|uniref:BTB domain-containing protein n=1 Tax=Sinanodonta woodiana TaxID=1069815 RepID=A0ABD3UEN8_SINWO
MAGAKEIAGKNLNKPKVRQPPTPFQKTAWTDLVIVVGEDELFFNKYPLVMTSPLLKKALTESDDPARLVLKDDTYYAVLDFLSCLHPEESTPITDKNLENVISMAHKYQHKGMLSRCEEYLQTAISKTGKSNSDLCFYIHIAEEYGLPSLVEVAESSTRAEENWFITKGGMQSSRYFKGLSTKTQMALMCTRLTYLEDQLLSVRYDTRGKVKCKCLDWLV